MSFRPDSELEASFRRVEQMLDAMLEESRAFLEREGIRLRDATNRSGFDGSGFPSFIWAHDFEKRMPFRSEIKLAAASLWYREPVYEEEAQTINVTSSAQIFQIGKQSRVRERKEVVYPIGDFLKRRFSLVGKSRRQKPARLAGKLLHLRSALGLSQSEMVQRLGFKNEFSRNYVSAFELGTREPPLPVLLQYARVAGVCVDAMIDDELDLPAKLPSAPRHKR